MILRVIYVFLFFQAPPLFSAAAAAAPSLAKPGCSERCGNVSIPYPFGIGSDCALSQWFIVNCDDKNYNPPKPFLNSFIQIELQGEVVNISLQNQTVTTLKSIVPFCDDSAGRNAITNGTDLSGSPFYYSKSHNKFLIGGCGNALLTQNSTVLAGCTALCSGAGGNISTGLTGCYGINCCETPVPFDLITYSANFTNSGIANSGIKEIKNCNSAFLVDQRWVPKQSTSLIYGYAPVIWTWTVRSQDLPADSPICRLSDAAIELADGMSVSNFRCDCPIGTEGNPYIANGCQACVSCRPGPDITGKKLSIFGTILLSAGILVFVLCIFFLYKKIKKRRAKRIRAKFFKRNGGLLLQQQLSSNEDDVIDRTKLFTAKELEKATDRFNENRILGRGGQGTVYKGMLVDGRIVAVKKSVRVDECKTEEFINEVVILSRVNHRNVVKLLGCCLETEVPLLVYEFITNGTLFSLIHGNNEEFIPFSWEMRLKIANQVADALAYLHSSSSIPILHRDIKSSNILLDEKYRAKVSDFGTSKSIAIDQTHVTTQVKGTFGYLDPEYFQTSQFTEKSDVYSFGVVLVELMTGNKAISFATNEQERSLATRFLSAMEENRLFKIVDKKVLDHGKKEDVVAIGKLARRCLDLNGKKRPSMKEVVAELEKVRLSETGSFVGKNFEGKIESMAFCEGNYTWTTEESCSTISLDAHPLLLETESTVTYTI